MDWSKKMNLAIDYIEENLNGELDLAKVARIACSSPYHFQRMFFAMIGVTPAEYTRRRRLTMAASDLATGNEKVIDIALKYGYESPNAFTRAFKNMHGINPSEAKKLGVKLSVSHRVSYHVEVKGENDMNYTIINKPAFQLMGKSKKFSYEKFIKQGPKFWKEYVATQEYQSLWELNHGIGGLVTEAPLMSVYLPTEKDNRDVFIDVLGVEKKSEMTNKNFQVFNIPEATYAEFNCTYNNSMKMNKYIYGEWFSSTGYERDGDKPDIAAYFPVAFRPMKEMRVRWWIPIVKK